MADLNKPISALDDRDLPVQDTWWMVLVRPGKTMKITILEAARYALSKVWMSTLPAAGALTGTEIVPLEQGGVSSRTTALAIANLAVSTQGWQDVTVNTLTRQAVNGERLFLNNVNPRGNSLLYSEQLDNAAWTKTNATITPNAASWLTGLNLMDKVVESVSGVAAHTIFQGTGSFTAASTITVSCFVKAAERGFCRIELFQGSDAIGTYIDIAGNALGNPYTAGAGVITDRGIVDCGNGIKRIWVTGTLGAATSASAFLNLNNALNSNSYAGDGTSGLFACGFQFEVGPIAAYILTTSVAGVAGTSIRLPANPTQGHKIHVYVDNGREDNQIDTNGKPLMNKTDPSLQLDGVFVSLKLEYLNNRWRTN